MPAGESASIAHALTQALGIPFEERSREVVGGGSINAAFKYSSSRQSIFVKVSTRPDADEMLAAEVAGLRALTGAQAIRVPQVVLQGHSKHGAFLALEWIDFSDCTRASEATLGEQLACQHRKTHELHGWEMDNTIGSTPQINTRCRQWPEFYRERRLRFQLDLAAKRGADSRIIERGYRLSERMSAFFATYRPAPSLLHGDLWGGNVRCDEEGSPVIFDPAVYYGDRETDIAMTRLFGGFSQAFYAAYHSTWPLDDGAETRVTLYNLYHVLNHYNLFRGSYLSQAKGMIDSLLAELD